MNPPDRSRSLLFFGYLLFLFALLGGLFIPLFKNPHMALSGHLSGLLNAMFLILLGLVWERLRLQGRSASLVFGLALYATYTNWVTNLLGASMGTGTLTPLAAGGRVGKPWQEIVVNIGAVTLGIAILTCTILILRSLRRPAAGQTAADR